MARKECRREKGRRLLPKRRGRWIMWVLGSAAALWGGCRHTGTGTGELRVPVTATSGLQPKGPVEFVWSSGADPSAGRIEAFMPDGRRFRGTYVHPRTTQQRNGYDLYWGLGGGPWAGAASPWYPGAGGQFTTFYRGTALAHLEDRLGTRMRCLFTLYRPNAGLAGGGQGDCELSTSEEVFDAVLREHS